MMGYSTGRCRNCGFTLIELMVVIVIIAILSSLMLTAVSAGFRFSRRVRTDMEIDQLEDAWLLYRQTYGKWPDTQLLSGVADPELRAFTVDAKIRRLLSEGENEDGQNRKKHKFMVFKNEASDGTPVTLWFDKESAAAPTADYMYFCKFDTDYNNIIQQAPAFPPGIPPTTDVRASVIVWALNRDSMEITGSWER